MGIYFGSYHTYDRYFRGTEIIGRNRGDMQYDTERMACIPCTNTGCKWFDLYFNDSCGYEDSDGSGISRCEKYMPVKKEEWHSKTVGPLTYRQAREYFSSLGVGFKFPSIKELRDGMASNPIGFMTDYDYWAKERDDETMHAWAVHINGDADTMKYEEYAYFRPLIIPTS